jgi:hypothetical protein
MFQILQTLTRALAPVLCHTAEEVYQNASPSLRSLFRQHNSFLVPTSQPPQQSHPEKTTDFDSLFCHGWFFSVSCFDGLLVPILVYVCFWHVHFQVFAFTRIRNGLCQQTHRVFGNH